MLDDFESPIHSPEKKLVIKTIAGMGGKVSPAEVSSSTGLPLLQTTFLLNRIASETSANLIVDTNGGIAYKFDPRFESSYILRGTKNILLRIWRIFLNASMYVIRLFCLIAYFLFRISFGILLVLSVVLVIALAIVLIVRFLGSLSDNNSDSGDGFDLSGLLAFDGGWYHLRYWTIDWVWDWFSYRDYIMWSGASSRRLDNFQQKSNRNDLAEEGNNQAHNNGNFLDNCFIVLFGLPDPNAAMEERYWQTLAQVIRTQDGVLTAEQLAPYCLVKGTTEDWILPILVRFNGLPEVSERGNIIYNFPSFRLPALASSPIPEASVSLSKEDELRSIYSKFLRKQKITKQSKIISAQLQPYLYEQPWRFTGLSQPALWSVFGFAAFAVFGSIWLLIYYISGFLVPVLLAICAYGLLFFIVPAIRWFIVAAINKKIDKNNNERSARADHLIRPDDNLRIKLDEASDLRSKQIAETEAQTVYTTEADLLEQDFQG